MSIKTIDKQTYIDFSKDYPYHDFLHSTYAADKLVHNGWTCEYIGYYENDELKGAALVGLLPLMKVFKYAYIPRGMIVDHFNENLVVSFTNELKSYLKKKKVVYLEEDPGIPYKERDKDGNLVEGGFDNSITIENLEKAGFHHLPMTQGYDLSKQCRWVSKIDLRGKTCDEIFSEFSYMTRQDIRTSKKYCIKVRELKEDELSILDKMEQGTGERHNFETMSMDYYKELYRFYPGRIKTLYAYLDLDEYGTKIYSELEKLEKDIQKTKDFLEKNPDNVKKQKRLKTDEEYHGSLLKKKAQIVDLKEKHGKEVPLACSLFLKYGNTVIYLVGASDYEYRLFKGPYAIQWTMIQEAIEEGYTYYDFYGISGYFEKGQDGYGVFDYKRGYNAVVYEYIGNFILPIDSVKYALYNKMKSVE